jgi:hypothetical protein
MSLIRTTLLALLLPAALALGCTDTAPPTGNNDASADTVTGIPGTGTGGSTGTPGFPTGTGGSTATGGSGAGSGTGGTTGLPPIAIPDGGIPGLDGGIPGLVDAGVLAICPAMPSGKACGAPGAPIACVVQNSQPPQGCVCVLQRWFCAGDTAPGIDAGSPIGGQPPAACPAGAMGMTCPMVAAVCTTGMGGCICIPGAGGALAWRCQ